VELVTLLLLVVALGFLISGIVASNPVLVVGSIVTSAVVALLIIRERRRRVTSTARAAVQSAAEPHATVSADEPAAALTTAPTDRRPEAPVWVVDGRPRYHLSTCASLANRDTEIVPLSQAVQDGFTPCALCDPDTALAAG
jgi:hypothetical protein